MNRGTWLLCALCCSMAWGQAAPETSAGSKQAGEREDKSSSNTIPASSVAMDAPVLTLKGFCPEHKASSAEGSSTPCETVITRAQFEKLAAAIRPNMTASAKQQLASLYPHLLVMAHKAEELGLDKQSPYEEMIVFSRMQILTQGLTHKLQEESANISDQEIADYYRINEREAKDRRTLEQASADIRETLKDERAKAAMGRIQNSYRIETNQAYFGSPPRKSEQ